MGPKKYQELLIIKHEHVVKTLRRKSLREMLVIDNKVVPASKKVSPLIIFKAISYNYKFLCAVSL